MENVKQYLEALEADPKAAELLKAEPAPQSAQGFAELHAAIAEKLGFDVTAEELLQYLGEMQKEIAANSDKAAEEVQDLSLEELDMVAGGKDHEDCKDTYKSRENCFANDGCDAILHGYPHYRCAHTYYGGASMCDIFVVYEL